MISLSTLNICACSGSADNSDHKHIIIRKEPDSSRDSLLIEPQKGDQTDTMKVGIIRPIDSMPKSKRKSDRIKSEKKEIHRHAAPGQTAIDSIKKAKEEKKFNKE